MKKIELLPWGLANVFSPIPVWIAGVLLCWILFFGVGMGIFGVDEMPLWVDTISLMPLLLLTIAHLTSCLMGVIAGISRRKEQHGIWCSVLSAIGLMAQCGLWAVCLWAGRHF